MLVSGWLSNVVPSACMWQATRLHKCVDQWPLLELEVICFQVFPTAHNPNTASPSLTDCGSRVLYCLYLVWSVNVPLRWGGKFSPGECSSLKSTYIVLWQILRGMQCDLTVRNFTILCPDGTLQVITWQILTYNTSPEITLPFQYYIDVMNYN